jgi:Holliday junction resolvase RusA-like endonuclease
MPSKMTFDIPVTPIASERLKGSGKGGYPWGYPSPKMEKAEKTLKEWCSGRYPKLSGEVGIKLDATFYIQQPQFFSTAVTKAFDKPGAVKLPLTSEELDNYYHTLSWALAGILYGDPKQVTTTTIRKRFGAPPHIVFTIEVDNGE